MMEVWQGLSLIVVFSAVIGSALVFMVSKFLQARELEAVAKAELVFALSSIFIIAFLVVLIEKGAEMGADVLTEVMEKNILARGVELSQDLKNSQTPLNFTKVYILEMVKCAEDKIYQFGLLGIPLGVLQSISVSTTHQVGLSGWAYKPFFQFTQNAISMLTFYVFVNFLQLHILEFVEGAALGVFLPLGIGLRAFPPTRGAGAYLIAATIGLYLVYPTAYGLAAAMSPELGTVCLGVTEVWTQSEIEAPATGLGDWIKILFSVGAKDDKMAGAFDESSNLFIKIFFEFIIVPVIALTVVFSFVLSTSGLFGADIPELGRGLIKLI